jgi:hypothetical protein
MWRDKSQNPNNKSQIPVLTVEFGICFLEFAAAFYLVFTASAVTFALPKNQDYERYSIRTRADDW